VTNLALSPEKEIIDIITHQGNSEGTASSARTSRANTHAERVKAALGNMFMDTPCSHCGSSKVIRAGACGVCTDCGTSQGCS
jgi:hypothetical protein